MIILPEPAGRQATPDDTKGVDRSLEDNAMRCTKCGNESITGRKFCATCGSPLSSRCPKCGAENAPSSAFCEDCGAALAGNAASAATVPPHIASTAPQIRVTPEQPDASTLIEGERKTVTALFADIKGSVTHCEDAETRTDVEIASEPIVAGFSFAGTFNNACAVARFAAFACSRSCSAAPDRSCVLSMATMIPEPG